MSLLLDALKRAEQEKLARGDRPELQVVGESGAAHAAPAPEPARPTSTANASLELQPIASSGPSGGTGAHAGKAQQTPAQAKVVFQAKANAAGAERPKRGLLYAAAASITIAILAAGGYVWYAMKSLAAPAPMARAPLPPPAPQVAATPASGAVIPAAADVKPAPDKALANPVPPSAAGSAPTAPGAAPAVRAAEPATSSGVVPAPGARKPAPPAPTREEIVQELLRQPAARREAPVRLDRSQAAAPTPAAGVSTGYAALRGGDLQAARRSYQSALQAEPGNIDALLGIATLDAREARTPAAAEGYRRVLELDPRNETALAGLAALADASRGGSVEAQLRQDTMRHPNSAALHFALGNLLAAQGRWSEAQGEYFEAHRLDPGNADVAHNLAVSLDNLGQSRLAVDFYRRALDAARSQPGQFDPAPVERRIAEMLR